MLAGLYCKHASLDGAMLALNMLDVLWSCWNREDLPLSAYVAENLYLLLNVDDAITDVQDIHALWTNMPPCRHKCWLLNCDDELSMIFENNLKFWLIIPQNSLAVY